MDWMSQDWEHECQKDDVYAIERQMLLEEEWYQEETRKKRLPAIIKVLTPIKQKKDANRDNALSF